MIRMFAAAILLTGCCTHPAPTPPAERIVSVAKPVFIHPPGIDSSLLRDCEKPEPTENSARAYADAMRAMAAAIDECNLRLRKARGNK